MCKHEGKLGCCGNCPSCCECYKCQYCEKLAPKKDWGKGDVCPTCGGVYNFMLAQEGDD